MELPQLVMIKIQDKIKSQNDDEQGNTKFSHNDKTRNNMVRSRNRNGDSLKFVNFYFR